MSEMPGNRNAEFVREEVPPDHVSIRYPNQIQALHRCVDDGDEKHFYFDSTTNSFQNAHCAAAYEKYILKK